MWHDPKIALQHWLPLNCWSCTTMFPHRVEGTVCRGLCYGYEYTVCIHVHICMHVSHALGEEWMRATGAQSAGGRGKIEGKEGTAVDTKQVPTLLGQELSNSGWDQNNRQQTLSMVSQIHILYSSAQLHVCAPFLSTCWSPAVSKGGQPCLRQASSSFISRPAAQQSRHNEL